MASTTSMNGCRLMVAAIWNALPASTGGFYKGACWPRSRCRHGQGPCSRRALACATYSIAMLPPAADLVLDDDGVAGERAQLLGKIAHDHVGAAAGRKRADEVDILIGILLRLRGQRQCGSQAASPASPHRQRVSRPLIISIFAPLSCVRAAPLPPGRQHPPALPGGTILAILTYSAQLLISFRNSACAWSGGIDQRIAAELARNLPGLLRRRPPGRTIC